MKFIIAALRIIALGFVVAAWLFSFELAYDAHVKQMALAAWMGGASSCNKQSSFIAPQRETGRWEIEVEQ